jgi:hypothetical protein
MDLRQGLGVGPGARKRATRNENREKTMAERERERERETLLAAFCLLPFYVRFSARVLIVGAGLAVTREVKPTKVSFGPVLWAGRGQRNLVLLGPDLGYFLCYPDNRP